MSSAKLVPIEYWATGYDEERDAVRLLINDQYMVMVDSWIGQEFLDSLEFQEGAEVNAYVMPEAEWETDSNDEGDVWERRTNDPMSAVSMDEFALGEELIYLTGSEQDRRVFISDLRSDIYFAYVLS